MAATNTTSQNHNQPDRRLRPVFSTGPSSLPVPSSDAPARGVGRSGCKGGSLALPYQVVDRLSPTVTDQSSGATSGAGVLFRWYRKLEMSASDWLSATRAEVCASSR